MWGNCIPYLGLTYAVIMFGGKSLSFFKFLFIFLHPLLGTWRLKNDRYVRIKIMNLEVESNKLLIIGKEFQFA